MSGIVSVDLNPGSIIEGLGKVVDDLWTSDEERLQARAVLEKMSNAERLGQIQVNIQEAKHSSIIVAGWRPAIGWTCAAAMLYAYLIRPLIMWLFIIFYPELTPPPETSIAELMTLLIGMLGFYGMRSNERVKGKA